MNTASAHHRALPRVRLFPRRRLRAAWLALVPAVTAAGIAAGLLTAPGAMTAAPPAPAALTAAVRAGLIQRIGTYVIRPGGTPSARSPPGSAAPPPPTRPWPRQTASSMRTSSSPGGRCGSPATAGTRSGPPAREPVSPAITRSPDWSGCGPGRAGHPGQRRGPRGSRCARAAGTSTPATAFPARRDSGRSWASRSPATRIIRSPMPGWPSSSSGRPVTRSVPGYAVDQERGLAGAAGPRAAPDLPPDAMVRGIPAPPAGDHAGGSPQDRTAVPQVRECAVTGG